MTSRGSSRPGIKSWRAKTQKGECMKGYYVIPLNGEIVEFNGKGSKAKAFSYAKKIILDGDDEVMVHRFDTDGPDGYFASSQYFSAADIL